MNKSFHYINQVHMIDVNIHQLPYVDLFTTKKLFQYLRITKIHDIDLSTQTSLIEIFSKFSKIVL